MTNPNFPPKRNNKPLIVVLSSILALMVLCCGGVWALGTFGPDPAKKAVSSDTTARPAFVTPTTTTPTTTPTTEPTTEPPVVVTTSPTPKPKPTTVKPTTTKPKPKPTKKPTTKPKPKPTTPSKQTGVHPGAFCSPPGALGTTVKGTLMRCSFKSGDDRARWRAA